MTGREDDSISARTLMAERSMHTKIYMILVSIVDARRNCVAGMSKVCIAVKFICLDMWVPT